jgi:hypothetical protein
MAEPVENDMLAYSELIYKGVQLGTMRTIADNV